MHKTISEGEGPAQGSNLRDKELTTPGGTVAKGSAVLAIDCLPSTVAQQGQRHANVNHFLVNMVVWAAMCSALPSGVECESYFLISA